MTGELLLPDSLTLISTSAFRYCEGFTGNLTIPEGVKLGSYAFHACYGFTGVLSISENVKYRRDTFEGCSFSKIIDNGRLVN